jgi:glycosyltransferase involved in cell wall biosynthesis
MNDQKNSRPAACGPSTPSGAPQRFQLLHVGPLRHEDGIELLADAFLSARAHDPRLHLVIAGGGSAEPYLRDRLGDAATFLGWLDEDRRAPVYTGADLLVVATGADPSGRAILEAQASGLPVLAVDAGAAPELIEPGRSGCLVAAEADVLAAAIRGLARRAALCERLAAGGVLAARRRANAQPVARCVARAA